MNGTQSIHYNANFVPPPLESIWGTKSLIFLFLNIISLGSYGAAEKLWNERTIKKLKVVHSDLQDQAAKLNKRWDALENELSSLLHKFQMIVGEDAEALEEFKADIDSLNRQKEELQLESISADYEVAASLVEVALGTIYFLGLVFANILTLGLLGVVQNYSLKNKVRLFEAYNVFTQHEFDSQRKKRSKQMHEVMDFISTSCAFKDEAEKAREKFDEISNTDQGKAYLEAAQAKQDLADLQKKQAALQADVAALRTNYLAAQQGKTNLETDLQKATKNAQDLQARWSSQNDQILKLQREKDNLKGQNDAKENELNRVLTQKRKELADLQANLNAANLKANRVASLENEVDRLRNAASSDTQRLLSKIGPVPPKYTPTTPFTKFDGAVDLIDPDTAMQAKLATKPAAWLDAAKVYNDRYAECRTAGEIVEKSFLYSFNEMLEMAKPKDGKIKINDSCATMGTPGEIAVYNFMVLDIIKGAKMDENGCQGHFLQLNRHVEMIPTKAQNVLEYKKDSDGKTLLPVVVVRYQHRDDFTAEVDNLNKAGLTGVDPAGAKFIWEQLTDDERGHLFNLLTKSVIENNHPELMKTVAFIRDNSHDPRVALILKGVELIEDISDAMSRKYKLTVLGKCWRENTDTLNNNPFVKAEDKVPDYEKIPDIRTKVDQGPQYVEWEVPGMDVLGDASFSQMLLDSKFRYDAVNKNLGNNIIANPEANKKKTFTYLDWAKINEQFYVSHEMIGSNTRFQHGQRCLFSNLLAIFMTDMDNLTVKNVRKLKRSMSNYLGKLLIAKNEYAAKRYQLVPPANLNELKKQAEMYDSFERQIRSTHKCSVLAYQQWLREEGNPGIDISDLTTLEINLFAETIGHRIGVVQISGSNQADKVPTEAVIDEYGRLVPGEYHFFGPNTKAFFLMGAIKGGYYGLHHKLTLSNPTLAAANDNDYQDMIVVNSYWQELDKRYHSGVLTYNDPDRAPD